MRQKKERNGRKRMERGTAAWIREHAELLCFVSTVFIALLYHLAIAINFGDDVDYYRVILKDISLWDLMKVHWNEWSSRTFIDVVTFLVIDHVFLWKLVDTAVFVLIGWALGRLTGEKMLCYAFLLMYPFYEMSEAGWIATTTNYFWPLGAGLAVCLCLKKSMDGQKVKWYEYLWSVPAVLFACNQELLAAVMTVVTLTCMALCLSRKKRKIPYIYLMLALELFSLAYILTCPGNYCRNVKEIAIWIPEFAEFSFGTKLYMGLYNVARVYIASPHSVFWPAAVILLILVYKKTGNHWKTLVSSIAVLLPFAYCISEVSEFLKQMFREIPETFDLKEAGFGGMYRYVIPVYVLAVAGSMIFSFYILLGEDIRRFLAVTVIVGAGFMSTVVMGFTPTLYASGNRVQIFFIISLVFATATCFHCEKKSLAFSVAGKRLLIDLSVLWTAVNVLGELLLILHMRRYFG